MILFKDFIESINYAVLLANDHIMGKHEELFDTYFMPSDDDSDGEPSIEARSVSIKYPINKGGGISTVDVDVPLITLVPITFTQVDRVKLKISFDVQIVNDELSISFDRPVNPSKSRSFFKGKNKDSGTGHSAELEVVITPQEGTEGLKRLIEGYEKTLRAQIP